MDFMTPFRLFAKLLHSVPYFTTQKDSQKYSIECKMLLLPTFSLFEIDPWVEFYKHIYALHPALKLYAKLLRLK